MRTIPIAPDAKLGVLSAADMSSIEAQVTQALIDARSRCAGSVGGVRGATSDSEAARGRREAASETPTNNMGGKSQTQPIAARLVLENGEVMEVPARRGWGGDSAFIDWINFTTDEVDFFFGTAPVSDAEVMDKVSYKLETIFGFGITEKRPTGANFFQDSYILGEACGMVCHGGQRGRVLVMLSGAGCAAAKPGWEKRLHDFLNDICQGRGKITRIDLAHDCYEGEMIGPVRPNEKRWGYSVDAADQDYENGLFGSGGRMPDIEHRGNWRRINGKGRTVYIGHRTNGKFLRVYEKGLQLKGKNSPWVRVECELKSISRIIPYDTLLRAGEYLAACYPALAWINEHQERILTTQKETQLTYASVVKWLHHQCGAALNVLYEIEGGAEEVLALVRKVGAIPTRLKKASWLYAGDYVHNEGRRETLPVDVAYQACLA